MGQEFHRHWESQNYNPKIMETRITITGNADDPQGSPLAKIRKTKNQAWKPEVQKYARWKDYVLEQYHKQTKTRVKWIFVEKNKKMVPKMVKPLVTSEDHPAQMHIKIQWKNGVHADPEGVFGSIADALFSQDKYLSGSFEADPIPKGEGKVEIIINS